jgi:hypothetical protein
LEEAVKLTSTLDALADGTLPASFAGLRSHVELEWIESALALGGMAKVRKRKLPAADVVWLTIGMSLYRDQPISAVVDRLDLVLPEPDGKMGRVTSGALPQARDRVGAEPMRQLFGIASQHWARESAEHYRWRGLMVLGADGSSLRVADTAENRKAFHLPGASRGTAGYPQVRVAVLMVLRSHLWLDFDFADYQSGEGTLAWPLIQRVPDQSVTILDRYYINHAQLYALHDQGKDRHWLLRARKGLKWRVVKRFGRGDELVEITFSSEIRKMHPEWPPSFWARAIRYRRKGFRERVLLTSLLDPQTYPAGEIAELYHERWELELGYDELKTHTLQQEPTLRSKTPERVRQELWGMAIAYNLVRREMDLLARERDLPPHRLSFRTALLIIRELFTWAAIATPGRLPKMVQKMRHRLQGIVLPPRRSERRYPRHVKVKMSNYARNRRHPR